LGRLFDAAAALAGLGTVNTFEAQLPMALEAAADPAEKGLYTIQIDSRPPQPLQWEPRPLLLEMAEELGRHVPAAVVCARFHNTVAGALLQMAEHARRQTGIRKVALAGGVFCNRFLTNRLIEALKQNDFAVLWMRKVPANDGGLALGQAAIAAARMEMEQKGSR